MIFKARREKLPKFSMLTLCHQKNIMEESYLKGPGQLKHINTY